MIGTKVRDWFDAVRAEFGLGLTVCRGCLTVIAPAEAKGDESPMCPTCWEER